MIPCALNLALRGACPLVRSLTRPLALALALSLSLSFSRTASCRSVSRLELSRHFVVRSLVRSSSCARGVVYAFCELVRSCTCYARSEPLVNRLSLDKARSPMIRSLCTIARSLARTRSRARDEIRDTAARLTRQAAARFARSSREFATLRDARVTIRPVRTTAHRAERINARPFRTTMFPYRGGRIELNTVSRANYKMAEGTCRGARCILGLR